MVEEPNKPTLFILQGYPSSGKSTRAKHPLKLMEAAGDPAAIVCRDDLRMMLHGTYWSGDAEKERHVTVVEYAAGRRLLEKGVSVILDATNLEMDGLQQWEKLSRRLEIQMIKIPIHTSGEECIRRDRERAARGERSVGAEPIERMMKKYPMHRWPK